MNQFEDYLGFYFELTLVTERTSKNFEAFTLSASSTSSTSFKSSTSTSSKDFDINTLGMSHQGTIKDSP